MATSYNPMFENRVVGPAINGVLAIFLRDGIQVTEDSNTFVTGPSNFPTLDLSTPIQDPLNPPTPWVSFGLTASFQASAVQVENEVTEFHGNALGYRQLRKNTTTGKRFTFTTPDQSPEYFELAFAIGDAPNNGTDYALIGHGGDNKISGYLAFWYQDDTGVVRMAGLCHGDLRITQIPEQSTAIGSTQFEFELDYKGTQQFTPSNIQAVTGGTLPANGADAASE